MDTGTPTMQAYVGDGLKFLFGLYDPYLFYAFTLMIAFAVLYGVKKLVLE